EFWGNQLADAGVVVQNLREQLTPGVFLGIVQRIKGLQALDSLLVAGAECHQCVPFLGFGFGQHLAGQVGDFLVALKEGGVRHAERGDSGQWLEGGSPNCGSTAVCQALARSVSIFSAESSLDSSLCRLACIRSRMMSW